MRRRDLLALLGGAAAVLPLAAEAQQAGKVARIGYLAANLAASPHLREAFLHGLRDLGYVEGRNVVIDLPPVWWTPMLGFRARRTGLKRLIEPPSR
jgi:putative tryptophan/tyrosine transport system substrate-binding protein